MKESVIDFPKDGLCPEVWEKVMDEEGASEVWRMIPEVKQKLVIIATTLCPDATVIHVTGSITSNQYTKNADIDLHFKADKMKFNSNDEVDDYNKKLRRRYEKAGKQYVGEHPIEVYYQENEFQDFMSVGCYNIFEDRWEVGPEFTDPSFNPYSEYYKEIKGKSEELANQIRSKILSIYENAVVLKKNIGKEYEKEVRSMLLEQLAMVQALYDNIRRMRKVYSSPTSKEEAFKFRASRKWKIADGAFKLFDKYGYLAILKKFIEDFEILSSSDSMDVEISSDIISTVKDYIGNADKLSEDEQVDEGAMSNALLATLLAVPGILPAKTIQKSIDNNQRYEMIVKDINNNVRMIGDYTAFQAANIIARTLYAEARNDGEKGMTAVASVIYNRAKGNKEDFTKVCLKPKQFSCWNKFTKEEADPKRFQVKIPVSVKGNAKNNELWKKAMSIVADMLADSFKPITTANTYYNPKTANPKWAKSLIDAQMIGSHKFGTIKRHSAFI